MTSPPPFLGDYLLGAMWAPAFFALLYSKAHHMHSHPSIMTDLACAYACVMFILAGAVWLPAEKGKASVLVINKRGGQPAMPSPYCNSLRTPLSRLMGPQFRTLIGLFISSSPRRAFLKPCDTVFVPLMLTSRSPVSDPEYKVQSYSYMCCSHCFTSSSGTHTEQ